MQHFLFYEFETNELQTLEEIRENHNVKDMQYDQEVPNVEIESNHEPRDSMYEVDNPEPDEIEINELDELEDIRGADEPDHDMDDDIDDDR